MADWELQVVLLHNAPPAMMQVLASSGVTCIFFRLHSKASYIRLFFQLVTFWRRARPAVVHCHLFDACLLGLTAAWVLRIPKRIYTRHHSTLHHVYFPRAVWYDRYINTCATHIIAISDVVLEVLTVKESVPAHKCRKIPHGFDETLFSTVTNRQREYLQAKYNLNDAYPVIGVVARFTAWKGIQYIIPAFEQVLTMYPTAKLVLANAQGDFASELFGMLRSLPDTSYCTLTFEPDMPALYACMDVYVHTPVDAEAEAFGQTYVEAALAGVPMVCTLSGIAREWVVHASNALVVPYRQSAPIAESLRTVLSSESLRLNLVREAKAKVLRFSLTQHVQHLASLYIESSR